MPSAAQRLSRRLRELGRISDEPGRLTRTFLSPAMARANRQVARWMRDAGLRTRVDAVSAGAEEAGGAGHDGSPSSAARRAACDG